MMVDFYVPLGLLPDCCAWQSTDCGVFDALQGTSYGRELHPGPHRLAQDDGEV